LLEAIEIETGRKPTGAVIWLHGLGADGHDFAPIVPQLVSPDERPVRFVFPHAPVRPVTINGGMAMRAWYDILGFDRGIAQDTGGIRASDAQVAELIRRENVRGIPTNRIVLGGFLPGRRNFAVLGPPLPRKAGRHHGPVLLPAPGGSAAGGAHTGQLPHTHLPGPWQPRTRSSMSGGERKPGNCWKRVATPVEWHAYPMPHSVCPQEVEDIAAWLRKVL